MTARRPPRGNSGFTLLEILIAIFLFAIVLAAVFDANILTNKVIDSTDAQAEIHTRARTAMERISSDLAGICMGAGGFLQGKKMDSSQKSVNLLMFVSTAHVAFTREDLPAGMALIRYSVVEDTTTRMLKLFRLDVPYRPGYLTQDYSEQKGYLLADRLRAIQLRYFDKEGNEEDEWRSTPDSGQDTGENTMPAMIEVTLTFGLENQKSRVFRTAVALPLEKKSENDGVGHDEDR